MCLNRRMKSITMKASAQAKVTTVELANGSHYDIKKINNHCIEVCDQTIDLKNKIETVTIDYKNHFMTGFQFRRSLEKIQYRWFNINTQSKILNNSDWGNI